MKMQWNIRAADFGDIDRLALIGSATFLESFAGLLNGDAILMHCHAEHSASAYERYLKAGAQAWLAETEKGRAPVGYTLLGETNLPGSTPVHDIELKRIYVMAPFHGLGLGYELMKIAIHEARYTGASRLLLGVNKENLKALEFYKRQGFRNYAERKFKVGTELYEDFVLSLNL